MEKNVNGFFCPYCKSETVDWHTCDHEEWINGYEKVTYLQFKCEDCDKEFEAGVSFKATKFNFHADDPIDRTDFVIKEE